MKRDRLDRTLGTETREKQAEQRSRRADVGGGTNSPARARKKSGRAACRRKAGIVMQPGLRGGA